MLKTNTNHYVGSFIPPLCRTVEAINRALAFFPLLLLYFLQIQLCFLLYRPAAKPSRGGYPNSNMESSSSPLFTNKKRNTRHWAWVYKSTQQCTVYIEYTMIANNLIVIIMQYKGRRWCSSFLYHPPYSAHLSLRTKPSSTPLDPWNAIEI